MPRRRPRGFALAAMLSVFALARASLADPPSFAFTALPASLNLGVDPPARVEFTGPDVPIDSIELQASAGALHDLVRTGPGQYAARFDPPASHAPDVALLTVRARGGATPGVASIALAGRYHLTLTVEPHAQVSVFVASGEARHAVVPASGRLDMVLFVPPGVEQAHISATDRNGNTTDTASALDLPPSHRVVLLPAPPPPDEPRALRWIMIAATPAGALATEPPVTTVTGAVGEIRPIARGLFYVVAHPPRAVTPQTVTVRVEAPGTSVTPAVIEAVVPAVAPARIEFAPNVTARVTERFVLPVVVRDADGVPVRGLESALSVAVPLDPDAHIEARDDRYEISARAPERTGSLDIEVQISGNRLPTLHARDDVPIVAGPPVRVEVQSGILVVGHEGVVDVRGLDRFGNVATIGNPAPSAEGARVTGVFPTRDAIRVRLTPSANSIRLDVRGDYGLVDHADLIATSPPLRPFSLGVGVTVRHNLGALTMAGGVAVFGADLPLSSRFGALGFVSAGVEGGVARDAQNTTATLVAIPMFAHIGLVVRFGRFEIGPVVGVGGWAVFARMDTYDGYTIRQNLGVVGFSAAIVARVQTGIGRFWLQTGGVTGVLDSVPVDGTLGGIYGQLGWSAGL